MKITFDTDEINVTVKSVFRERASKEDLLYFLNELSIVYKEAAEFNDKMGCGAIAKDYREKADILYATCDNAGFYKGLN